MEVKIASSLIQINMLNNQSLKYHCLKFAFIILVYWTAIPVFSQDIYKNRISAFYTPITYFFDKTPISNGNVQMYSGSLHSLARMHYIGGFGFAYERQIKNNNYIHSSLSYFQATYVHNYLVYPFPEPGLMLRKFLNLEINYLRKVPLTKNLSLKTGGGILYKNGVELIILAKNPIYSPLANDYAIELHIQSIGKNDLALNAIARLEYTPKPIFTIFTELTYHYSIFKSDRKALDRLKSLGLSQFPSPHELAWRVGFGFNFGKGKEKKSARI